VGGSATSITHAKAISELFVSEDPTLTLSATAAQNAASVHAQVQASVSSVCPGATIGFDVNNLMVSVDFGDSCTLPQVGTVSGQVTAQLIQPTAGAIGVAFVFTSLTVNDRTLDGTYSISTSDAVSFTVDCALTSSDITLTLSAVDLVLDDDLHGLTLTGPGTVDGPVVGTIDLNFTGVHQGFSVCYPDGGNIGFSKNVLTVAGNSIYTNESITFGSSTPSDGQVQIEVESNSEYLNCGSRRRASASPEAANSSCEFESSGEHHRHWPAHARRL
jgi:hypothetical protein